MSLIACWRISCSQNRLEMRSKVMHMYEEQPVPSKTHCKSCNFYLYDSSISGITGPWHKDSCHASNQTVTSSFLSKLWQTVIMFAMHNKVHAHLATPRHKPNQSTLKRQTESTMFSNQSLPLQKRIYVEKLSSGGGTAVSINTRLFIQIFTPSLVCQEIKLFH